MRCEVFGCKSNNIGKNKHTKCSFFSIPEDEELCKKWVAFCNRKEIFVAKNARICEKHFKPSDFAPRNTFMEEQGFPPKKRLKARTIPTEEGPSNTSFMEKQSKCLKLETILLPRTEEKARKMSTSNSLCLTCLSNLEEGAKLTEALTNFLCDVLHFKTEILQESPKIICRKCYKTLIELKCFYTQLRDVEVYFESKSKINTAPDEDIEDEGEEPYIGDLECTVSIADDSKLDPILIDEDEECCVVEDDNALKQNKLSDSATGRRFVCLTCSKLFSSVDDLRSHERTHSLTPLQKPSPVFLAAAISQSQQKFTCPECRQEFFNKFSLEAHMKKHTKIRPFICKSCKHRFAKRDQLVYHESKYECMVCHNKCCSRTALETHMKVKHNGNMNGSHCILENVEIIIDTDQQHDNNIAEKQDT